MRKFITLLVLIPLAVLLVTFAVANRQAVTVSLDPFDQTQPALVVAPPLFALLLGVLIAGVVIGGAAAWIRQSKWRRAARLAQREARELNAELARLREQMGPADPRGEVAPHRSPRLVIPPPAA